MAYRYLGYGITNDKGIAKLEFDANDNPITHSYTGTSAGEIDIVASLDDNEHINDSSLQSEIYEVYDCTKYDLATSDSHNDIWTLGNNGSPKLERKTDYSTLSELISGTDAWITTQISHSCVVEFDVQVVSTDYTKSFCQFGQSVNALSRREIPLLIKDGNWHNIKLSLDNGTVVVSSKETSNTQTYNLNNYDATGQMYFRFRTVTDITEINFKNVKIYPI